MDCIPGDALQKNRENRLNAQKSLHGDGAGPFPHGTNPVFT
jgi:hypothetical protein